VDGVTYEEYEKDAARNIRELHQRLKEWQVSGPNGAAPSLISPRKHGETQRPISIPALEDKLVAEGEWVD